MLGDLGTITDRKIDFYNWVGLLRHIFPMRDMSVTLDMSRNPGQQIHRRARRVNNPNMDVRLHGVVVYHVVPIGGNNNGSA